MSNPRAVAQPTPMKEPRNYLIVILCAALLGAGILLRQQGTETDQWKARVWSAEKTVAQQAAERTALEKRLSDAQDRTAALQNELAAARDAQPWKEASSRPTC